MKNRLTIAAVAATVALVTLLIVKSIMPQTVETTVGEENEPRPPRSLDLSGIKLASAEIGTSMDVVVAAGRVSANASKVVRIGPRVAGRVVSIAVGVGEEVARGQVLATISSVELAGARAEYREASARLRAAEQAYRNQVSLAQLGAFARRPVEEARAEHVRAVGELSQAEAELARCRSELVQAESELARCTARLMRARELYKDQIVSRDELEAAEAEQKRDLAEVDAAKAKIRHAEARVEQSRSQVDVASKYLDRERRVADRNLLSTREIQAAKAQVAQARLEVAAAGEAIRVLGASPLGSGDTLCIRSPITGRVVERNASLGEMVEPEDTLFVVMDLSDVWVEASIYERDISRVRKGQPAEIRLNAYPDLTLHGKVAYVADVLDPESRTVKVRCIVSNPEGILKPDMFASINIITARKGRAILIPRQAVLIDSGRTIIFVACTSCPEDRKAGKSICGEYDRREVELGFEIGEKVEVRKGLNPGDQVVVQGQHQLKSALASGSLKAGCADED